MTRLPDAPESSARQLLTLAGLLLVALNLRPALTSVAPVLTRIGHDLGLASAGEGLLTTLPVLCLGLAAPLAPRLARRIGPERAVLAVLLVLAIALIGRPYVGTTGLFVGTAIAGAAIGIMGVLLPGLVKRDFPATAIIAPAIGTRMRDQRPVITTVMIITLIGLAGCIYAPITSIWLWIVILGLGQGGAFAMALTLLALRAADSETAAELSGMAQGIGYVTAACGPLAVGLIHQFFGGWSAIGVLIGVIGAGAIAAGLGAGRDRLVVGR